MRSFIYRAPYLTLLLVALAIVFFCGITVRACDAPPPVFSAPVYVQPVFAAPMYQVPIPVQQAPVYQQAVVQQVPVYQQQAVVLQQQVRQLRQAMYSPVPAQVVVRAPRVPILGRFRANRAAVSRTVVRQRGVVAAPAAVIY